MEVIIFWFENLISFASCVHILQFFLSLQCRLSSAFEITLTQYAQGELKYAVMLITSLVGAFKQMPGQAGQHSLAVAPFLGVVKFHHISSCVRTAVGAVNTSWPQQIKRDKRIPALCCASVCLSVFVVGDLHCFRSGERRLCFCCQLEDVFPSTSCCSTWFPCVSSHPEQGRSSVKARNIFLCSGHWSR